MGGRRGGAIQILALAPVVIVVFTVYWLAAGRAGSPAATLERYVRAWQEGRPEAAANLFVEPWHPESLAERWRADDAALRAALRGLASERGNGGLDAERPFESLVFDLAPVAPGQREVTAAVRVVRRDTVRTTFFGLFPAASQVTVPVAQVGQATLRAIPDVRGWFPGPPVWRLAEVRIGG